MKLSITSVLQHPILHFLLLGAVAFVAYSHLKPPGRETITVTSQTIDALVQQRESISQSPITPKDRQDLIEGYIEDEILLREAYRRGFDKNDYRVRKRILSIMRSSLSDVIPEPSTPQLRAFYEENKQQFLTAPSRSFEHVYFSFTSAKRPADPEQFIRQLRASADSAGLGEFALMGNTYRKASFRVTAGTFGKPFARSVFSLPLNAWRGPIESFRGIHYVRVTAEHEPELPPFEQMQSFLRTDYFLKKGRQSQIDKIDELRENYEIIVEGN